MSANPEIETIIGQLADISRKLFKLSRLTDEPRATYLIMAIRMLRLTRDILARVTLPAIFIMLAPVYHANAQKAVPRGVYVVLPVDDAHLSTAAAWSDPNIQGVLLRTRWTSVEPTEGQFNWSYFQSGLALAQANHKSVMLSIDGSQSNCPAWVYGAGAVAFPLSAGGNTPCPWDPLLQSKWSAMVIACAMLYDSNPAVVSVTMWAGGTAIETFFAQSQADVATLNSFGGVQVFLNGAEALVNTYDAFKATPCYLATGNDYPDGQASMTALADYVMARRGPLGGLTSCALSSSYPAGVYFPHTKIGCGQYQETGYQLLGPVGGSQEGATITLYDIVAQGQYSYAKWIQVYPGDPTTDPNESTIINFNLATGAQ